MAHSTRGGTSNSQPQVPSYYFDLKLMEQEETTHTVHGIIEDLVSRGAEILYMKYINSQIVPYASRTLARELVMNASWASFPLDCEVVNADPDEDLTIPLIDEWAGGVLPVRGSDSAGLRCSVSPQREVKRTTTTSHRARSQIEQSENHNTGSNTQSPSLTSRTASTLVQRTQKGKASGESATKAKAKPQLTEAQIITKKFDEARKKTNVMMKSVTVDSDFSVIQINEPKGLPPALIVPKVTTKKTITSKNQKQNAAVMPRIAKPIIKKTDTKRKRRAQTKLIEPDVPIFDEEIAEISFSDKFVCAPGVTFKDGNTVKSRPQLTNTAQLTRAQYEQYLEEMKKSSEE